MIAAFLTGAMPPAASAETVKGVCFDIDKTLTVHRLGYEQIGYFEFLLAGMLCRQGKLPVDALDAVCQAEELVAEADPMLAAEKLGVAPETYAAEVLRYQRKYFDLHLDTLQLLEYLAARNIPIYITTNNTMRRAEMTLAFLGIRDRIRKIYTPKLTGARKKEAAFWRYVIKDTGISGPALRVVGDEELSDCQVPLLAGFGGAYLLPMSEERKLLPSDWLIKKWQRQEDDKQ